LIIRATCEREYSGARRIEINTSSRIRSCAAAAVIEAGKIMKADYVTNREDYGEEGAAVEGALDGEDVPAGGAFSGEQFVLLVVAHASP
jgi:hypothetical protein